MGSKEEFEQHNLESPLKAWVSGRYSLGITAESEYLVRTFLRVTTTDFRMFDHLTLMFSLDKREALDFEYLTRFNEVIGIKKLLQVASELYGVVQPNWG